VVLASLLVVAFALWHILGVLPLVIAAVILSYLLWPLVNTFEQHVLFFLPFRVRSLAVFLTFVTVIALLVLVVLVIVPALVNQLAELGRSIPAFFEAMEAEVIDALSRPLSIAGRPILIDGEPIIPLDRIRAITGTGESANLIQLDNFDLIQALGTFFGSVSGLTGPAFNVLGGAFNAIINLVFLVFIMFYLMRDGEGFVGNLVNIAPPSYRGDVKRLLYELGRVWNAYLRGQLILSVSVGVLVYLAALVLGLPNAPILGLLAGVLEFIPNLGPILATIPAALIALFTESSTLPFLSGLSFALAVILVWTLIQQFESVILVPRVMGGSLNLHPVVVILALLIGASVGGALGVILAAPFTATARIVGMYVYGKLFDTDPFTATDTSTPSTQKGLIVRSYHVAQDIKERAGALIERLPSHNLRGIGVRSGDSRPVAKTTQPEEETVS
jgi:predicted PurR-regulated permease PerM